jgi:hypothetical protein
MYRPYTTVHSSNVWRHINNLKTTVLKEMFHASLHSNIKMDIIALVLLFTSGPIEPDDHWQSNLSPTSTITNTRVRGNKM